MNKAFLVELRKPGVFFFLFFFKKKQGEHKLDFEQRHIH